MNFAQRSSYGVEGPLVRVHDHRGNTRRALEHKRGEIEGFAARYHCTRVVYYESFDDVAKAIDREKQLKRWVRRKKIALIESRNPRWADLAEHWGAQMAFAGESMTNK